jgi:hypothetical protein
MTKWVVLVLLVGIGAGIGLWVALDPQGRAIAAQLWHGATGGLAKGGIEFDSRSLWAPVTGAFKAFADSVGKLLSPGTIRIEVPSIQVPH